MRLWHIDLISYLPKSQLLAQWRELNSIFKKQDKHILINYVYNYGKGYLYNYTIKVIEELDKRKCKIKSFENFNNYFHTMVENKYFKNHDFSNRFAEHNDEYLTICYYNLKEKYIRGQKDFTQDVWEKLYKFYKEKMGDIKK